MKQAEELFEKLKRKGRRNKERWFRDPYIRRNLFAVPEVNLATILYYSATQLPRSLNDGRVESSLFPRDSGRRKEDEAGRKGRLGKESRVLTHTTTSRRRQ